MRENVYDKVDVLMAETHRLPWRGRASSQDGEPCCSPALWKSGTHLSVNVSLTLGRKSQGHTLHPTAQQTQLDEERHGGPGLRDYQPVHRRCASSRGGEGITILLQHLRRCFFLPLGISKCSCILLFFWSLCHWGLLKAYFVWP